MRRIILPVVLILLAAFVLLGPARNYYVQWSAIRKMQAAFLAKDYAEQYRQLSLLANMGNHDAQRNPVLVRAPTEAPAATRGDPSE